ncbi:hypothetical protein ACJIZ3_001951 [Penstemon smallii]|uniref:RING-type E3 ubiquitin transferase BRCA1 n=1 Tax=Penstemon smallii TaxID=265156 RepID=A0ABD3U8P9_9LAMI
MESVVATVSGYNGTERFNLIKLISSTGASYVGNMNQFTTHLVCWKFEGKKYELAKRFNIKIVNHRWIEECIKKGRRVSEEPYTFQSGEEMGPLLLDIQLAINQTTVQSKAKKKLKEPVIDIDSEDMDDAARTETIFLDELEEPSTFQPARSRRLKKRNHISPERQRKGRKLAKKHTRVEDKVLTSNVEQEHHEVNVLPKNNRRETLPNSPDVERPQSTSNRHASDGQYENDALNDVVEIEDVNDEYKSKCVHGASSSSKNAEKNYEADDNNQCNRPSTATELSCVICWTDFCSTRGVLPCGHRFCFACIQNWADRNASERKPSTCPLCKASFICITKVDDAVSSDQKIYSQTIPYDTSKMDLYILQDEACALPANPSAQVCFRCSSREPEDLLVRCHLCQIRCVHSYCLDPPLLPWTCVQCKDLQMLYLRNR